MTRVSHSVADVFAVWLGKTVAGALRLLGRRGNALPGLVVERIVPGFLPRALARLPQGVVVVSGTNGKTTTTKMVATILADHYRVLTNETGSNFVRGAITAVCDNAGWTGRLHADVAVFELDEAHAVRFVDVVAPDRVLLLNVMRDQLDRFGEIDTTAGLLRTVAARATTAVVLNRDDPRIAAVAEHVTAPVTFYGVAPELRADFPTDEELYGVEVTDEDETRAPATAELLAMKLAETSQVRMRIDADIYDIELQAGGAHNAQNAAGAAALALTFPELTADRIADGVRAVEPAFGRGQSFTIDGRRLVLQLVKNPASFRQTLRTLGTYGAAAVVIAINDDYADSRDVSWLWDVDFVAPFAAADPTPWIVTSGTRAADMALRLRYDEIGTDVVEPELRAGVRRAVQHVDPGQTVVVLSTYTAMWALHSVLTEDDPLRTGRNR